MDKARLASYYTHHHLKGKKLGFYFGANQRDVFFKKHIGQGNKILDLGCRDGALTRHFMEGNHVIGVDIDQQALELCHSNLGIMTFWVDVERERLPFTDNEFDVIVAGEILEHLAHPEIVLEEISRILKYGGLFIGSVPNALRLKNRLRVLIGLSLEDDRTHLRAFSSKSLRELLSHKFMDIHILSAISRFLFLSPELFGNTLLFKCRKM